MGLKRNRNFNEDFIDKSLWVRCRRKASHFTITFWDKKSIYIDPGSGRKTYSSLKAPFIVRNEKGVFRAENFATIRNSYLQLDGKSIGFDYVRRLKDGNVVKVFGNPKEKLWAFHASSDVYGWDLPFGANSSNSYSGDGDYIVCSGNKEPELLTMRIIHTDVFNREYYIEEGTDMFEFKNSKWNWSGKAYIDIKEALTALCNDIVWSQEDFKPVFGDLGMYITNKLLLVYAIFELDLVEVLRSETPSQYYEVTGTDSKVLRCFELNPLYAKKNHISVNYKLNKDMQIAIFPELKRVYDNCKGDILTGRGEKPAEVVISFVCDRVLFNPSESPFSGVLDMIMTLDKEEITKGLTDCMTHKDIPRLNVLVKQLSSGDIIQTEPITIEQVRSCSYESKTREAIGKSVDYVQALIDSAPALVAEDYNTWVDQALSIKQTVKALMSAPVVVKPMITPEPEEIVYAAVNDDTDNESMHSVCAKYCTMCGVDIDDCRTVLECMGVETWEDFYRALPAHIRRVNRIVYEKPLIEYCCKLKEVYGNCSLT